MRAKKFDCVAMKRRGAAKIYEATKDMTLQKRLAFWQQRTRELRREQQRLRDAEAAKGNG